MKSDQIAYFKPLKLVKPAALILMNWSSILANAAQAMSSIVHSEYEYDEGKIPGSPICEKK